MRGMMTPAAVAAANSPAPTVIESIGTTRLVQIGDKLFLYDANGSGPSLKMGGTDVLTTTFGDGWTPIAAEKTATGYEVAWKMGNTGQYTVWNTDNNGNKISNIIPVVSGTTAAFQAFENNFHQDLNGD